MRDLQDLLGARGRGGRELGGDPRSTGGSVSRMSRWSVQSPPLLDVVGTPGSGVSEPNAPPPPCELEGRDVVLDAVVVAGEGRRAQQVDGAVRADQAAAGENRGCSGRERRRGDPEGSQDASHRSCSVAVALGRATVGSRRSGAPIGSPALGRPATVTR